MSDLANQVVAQATSLLSESGDAPTFASFEDALGASMSAEEVAGAQQLFEGDAGAPTTPEAASPPSVAAPASPIPEVVAAPQVPSMSPEMLQFMQQQAYVAQQMQQQFAAQQTAHQQLMQELVEARRPPAPPDTTPPEVLEFENKIRQKIVAQEVAPMRAELAAFKQAQAQERAAQERHNNTQFYVNQASQVAENTVLKDIDPSMRQGIAPAVRDMVLAVAAASGKPPTEVAPLVSQLLNQAVDARIKTLQSQAKARVQQNNAAPAQPQLRAVASGDSFDPRNLTAEDLHKMGAKDPLDAVFMAHKNGMF